MLYAQHLQKISEEEKEKSEIVYMQTQIHNVSA